MRQISLLLLIGITLIACNESKKKVSSQTKPESNDTLFVTEKNIQEDSIVNQDKIIGMYEYVYPDNASLNENHYILIEKEGTKYKGRYYGTSDEFDDAREGYLPGYFVADMEDLKITESDISFKLIVPNEKILTKQVDLKIKSYDEAISQGYENWGNYMKLEPKYYIGKIEPNGAIFFKAEYDFMDKSFMKKH